MRGQERKLQVRWDPGEDSDGERKGSEATRLT